MSLHHLLHAILCICHTIMTKNFCEKFELKCYYRCHRVTVHVNLCAYVIKFVTVDNNSVIENCISCDVNHVMILHKFFS